MDYRTGKCSQCGAEYQVPASFAHNVARCKKCKGVVHLGPAQGSPSAPSAAPTAVPAKRVVPKPTAPVAARPPTAEVRKGPPQGPAAEPGGERPKGGTLERLKGERPPPQPAAAAHPATPRPAAASGSARETDKTRAAPARGKRGARAQGDKKPPVAGILSGAALVLAVALVFLFREQLFGGGKGEAATGLADAAPSAPAPVAQPLVPVPSEAEREPVATAPTEEKPAKAEPKPKDPSSIDLAAIPDFQPTPDTSAEEWTKMNEWMAQWMDIDAGAAGNRAKLELVKQGRRAVPAILNAFKALDFATKAGRSNGDQCQKALQQICNGTNFDWKYADEADGRPYEDPDDVWFCKRVVELWSTSWKQAEQDIKAWIRIAKLEEKDPAEAKRLLELFGTQSTPDPAAGGAEDDEDLEVD